MSDKIYKISVNIPAEYSEKLKDAVTAAVKPVYPGYDRVFTECAVKGTWRPLEGSHPHNGKIGQITYADELRIEFAVRKDDLKKAVSTIVFVHPYEEPCIEIVKMRGWKGVIDS